MCNTWLSSAPAELNSGSKLAPSQSFRNTNHNNQVFLKKIDALPTQGAGWTCNIVTSKGDQLNEDGEPMPAEKLELWRQDPVECVRELLGNPTLKNYMKYTPEQVYEDIEGKTRIFNEMWMANWWWDTQVNVSLVEIFSMLTSCQKKLPANSTIAPLILSSDKTQLTQF